MCDMCNGMTAEQVRRLTLAQIAEFDHTVVGIEQFPRGATRSPESAYSIGLWAFRDVPELILVAPLVHAVESVHSYAEQVAAGRRFEPGTTYDDFLPGGAVRFERVARSR